MSMRVNSQSCERLIGRRRLVQSLASLSSGKTCPLNSKLQPHNHGYVMGRILYSSSPTPLRLGRNPSPPLPRLHRSDLPKLGLPPLIRLDFGRVFSVALRKENPFQVYCSQSSPRNDFSPLPSPGVTSSDNPCRANSDIIPAESSRNTKAITAKTFLVLSAIVAFLVQPVFAPAALATFQGIAKTQGQTAVTTGTKLIHTELLSGAWTGLLAGCLHTLSGPDHLAALAPLSIGRSRMESAVVGALWGCGHDAGQVIFGLLFLLLKDHLHIEIIRTWGTRVVGLTLLVIGAIGIKEALELHAPRVALESGGEFDVGAYEALKNPEDGRKKVGFATFATGIVHGLQPDALMMVLPALALPSRWAGAAFLIMFLVGTVVAMGSYTVLIGSCSEALKDRVPRITEKLTWASSLVAIALGIAILVSQIFGYSLY